MMVVFGVVGLIFLLIPGHVLVFFNSVSPALGLPEAEIPPTGFYHILAVAYMYLVSLLAYLMYRYPDNKILPLILAHGKLVSSFLSLGFFVLHRNYLIYITNCLIDGAIGFTFLTFYVKIKKTSP